MRRRADAVLAVLLTAVAASCAPEPSTPQGVAWVRTSLADARARARLEDRPLLVLLCPGTESEAATTACSPLLEEARGKEMAQRAEGVLPLLLYQGEPDGARLLRTAKVRQLPSLLLYSAAGDLLVRRDGAGSFQALQPLPDNPVSLTEVVAFRQEELDAFRQGQDRVARATETPEETLVLARRAVDNGNREEAGLLLESLSFPDLDLQDLVKAGDLAQDAGHYDLEVEIWQQMLFDYPDIGARDEALGRYARALVASGQKDRLEQYVFSRGTLRSQWEYLTVASAAGTAGHEELAARIARHGLDRFPEGPHTDALRFYLKDG